MSSAPAEVPLPDWLHECALGRRAPGNDARAFVHLHLVAHELEHLAGVAGVVASMLTKDVARRGTTALVATLAYRDGHVALNVDDTSGRTTVPPTVSGLLDVPAGSGIVGLLTTAWGVTSVSGRTTGLWATFDAPERPG